MTRCAYGRYSGLTVTVKEFKRIRKALGYGQEGLAGELGVARATVTRYENGSLPISNSKAKSMLNLLKLKELAA